ncbi:MAG: hypothetical protein ABSG63_10025 [Spirochaetia bacterium]|jgi:hypothetical protein
MKRRNDRRICLGIQWDAGSWDNALPWCEYLFSKLGRQRLHWNLPALPTDGQARKRAAFIKALRGRLEENGDAVTAAGFAGAFHPLLNLDELEKELAWGLKNPWGTGVTDALDIKPTVLVAPMPDLIRPEAWKLYQAHGFTQVGIRANPGDPPSASALPGSFTYTRLAVGEMPADGPGRFLRRLNASTGTIILFLDLSGLTGMEPLERAINECLALLPPADEGGLSLIAECAPAGPSEGPAALRKPPFDVSFEPAALLRAKLAAAEPLSRKKRKKAEEYVELLRLLGPGKKPAAPRAERQADKPHNARLVAHMLGEVSLSGDTFDVHLVGGRFCGITHRGTVLLPRRPAVSSMVVGGRTVFYKTQSSFSFEGENGTGLREELALDGGTGGSISIEYSFQDDSPLLSVTGHVRHPRIEPPRVVDEYAPFAFTLCEVPKSAAVEVQVAAPDESFFVSRLEESSGGVLLPGASYRVRCAAGGWALIRFSPRDSRKWGLASFRIVRARGKRFLECNPFGSYTPIPSETLGGTLESFSLFLGLEAD